MREESGKKALDILPPSKYDGSMVGIAPTKTTIVL
jgi:hypothetical protein